MLSVPPLPPEHRDAPTHTLAPRGSDEYLLERRARGDSMSAIAKDLGVAVSTVSRRLKKLEVKP